MARRASSALYYGRRNEYAALHQQSLIFSGPVKDWCEARGIDLVKYGRRQKERGTKVKNTFVSRSKHVQTAEAKATPSEIS